MKQQSLAMAADQGAGFEQYRRPTKRDVFLQTMNEIVPWAQLCEVIAPHYPKGEGGRPPVGLQRMLRMHFVQHWSNLADDACEEALLGSTSLRHFVGIDLVLCAPVVAREAKENKKTLRDHYAHLLVHGTLHAQGWDHETSEQDAEEMEAREIEILAGLDVKNPYV